MQEKTFLKFEGVLLLKSGENTREASGINQRRALSVLMLFRDVMDRLPRFSVSFYSCGMISTTTTTQVRNLVRQGLESPHICYHRAQELDQDESVSLKCSSKKAVSCYHRAQELDQDESVSLKCSSKKAVSWASSTVDNELTPKKSFQKEPYFSQVFEVNRETHMGLTAGSMQMKLVSRR